MWIRIKEGPVYTGKRNKPFAQTGELANVRKDVAARLVEDGVAEYPTDEEETDDVG